MGVSVKDDMHSNQTHGVLSDRPERDMTCLLAAIITFAHRVQNRLTKCLSIYV